ncbi:MAG: hypothetical protein KAW92_08380 [Candidatus Cloacimonetes bacterium]|nr:hypothetical protein [Candidatus Cloacimonadota bacterium]
MSTKKSKNISRRKAKSKERKIKRRKRRENLSSSREQKIIYRPAISDMDAPEGFCPISMSQALIEYAKPIRERLGEESMEVFQLAMDLAMPLWNYAIRLEKEEEDDLLKTKIIIQIKKSLKMNINKAREFFEMMVERKIYLLPPEIQPEHPMTMYIHKEADYLITDFDYNEVKISDETIPPDDEDKKLIHQIELQDKDIAGRYFKMVDNCNDRYKKWLIDKGLDKFKDDFPYCIEIFLNFIYTYHHDEYAVLKSISVYLLQEFFTDHLFRKVMVEPFEYVHWPPALKLFYRFLFEKEYLKNPEPVIELFTLIEPNFMKILRKRY